MHAMNIRCSLRIDMHHYVQLVPRHHPVAKRKVLKFE